jgi:PAS domain S-box-containing protein
MQGALTDVTDRDLLAAVVDMAGVLVLAFDRDGRIVLLNRGCELATGYTLAEVAERGLYETILPPADEEAYRTLSRRVRFGEAQAEHEGRIRTKDGRLRLVSWKVTAARDPLGRTGYLVATGVDVTEQRLAEEARLESELRFRQLAENVDEVFWMTDRENTQYLYLSPVFEKVWGRSYEPYLADHALFRDTIHPDDRAAATAAFDRSAETPFDVEYRILRPDGSERWIHDRSFLVRDEAGNVIRTAGIATDVTERRRENDDRRALEAQMRAAQKLESLGVLAGGIAHDFNNLLLGILGNAGLALAELPDDSPARQTVAQIELAGLRAAELTNQMLAYAGKSRFVVGPLDLSLLVEEMAHLLAATVPATATLRYELAEDLPVVEADRNQLRQVVMNLVANAADALADERGVITVRTGVVDADASYLLATVAGDGLRPGRYAYLDVSDTGSGMDEDIRSRIFEPFFTTKFTGRGLGLAGTLGIVRGHGGAIRVDSGPGAGTTVRVLLAAATVGVERRPGLDVTDDAVAGTVLVVDDEEAVRAVARAVLERAGFTVLTAEDGASGIELYRERSTDVDVVLLDLTMPVMGGEAVLTALRDVRPDARVVLSSGYSEEDTRNRIGGGQDTGFIQKPYGPAQLVEKLRETLAA